MSSFSHLIGYSSFHQTCFMNLLAVVAFLLAVSHYYWPLKHSYYPPSILLAVMPIQLAAAEFLKENPLFTQNANLFCFFSNDILIKYNSIPERITNTHFYRIPWSVFKTRTCILIVLRNSVVCSFSIFSTLF